MMSDLNLKIAEFLGHKFVQKTFYMHPSRSNDGPPMPVDLWVIIYPDGKESKQFLANKEDAVLLLPDWEHDIMAAANFARSTGQRWELHDLRSEGFVAKFGRKFLAQNDNPATAICEATLKWYVAQNSDLNMENADGK